MPRIRTIKPEFPQSESMGRVSRDARLLFIQLWTLCDDSGRARGNSRMLASLLFPYDGDAPKLLPRWMDELAREGCIEVYQVGTDTYFQCANWLKHQKIDKPSASKIPPPLEASRSLANVRECSSEDQGPRTKEGTKDQGVSSLRSDTAALRAEFDIFWDACSKKVGKTAAQRAYSKARKTATTEQLLSGMCGYRAATIGMDVQFVAHPATWLNAGRWMDETKPTTNGHDPSGIDPERLARVQAIEAAARKKSEEEANVH